MANATKKPRKLPEPTRRPQKSPNLKRFEAAIEGLNNLFHGTKNAWATGSLATGPRANKISPKLSAADLETSLHRLTLVYAVSLYEYFLKSLLTDTLLARNLPDKGRVEIDLGDLHNGKTLQEAVVDSLTQQAIGSGYAERPSKVRAVLSIDHSEMSQQRGHKFDLDLIKIACLIRNCIIHDDGNADARLIEGGKSKNLSLVLGSPIPLDEELLWSLVDALRKHARALDLMVGWQASIIK